MTTSIDLILTAANRAQARGYGMQLRRRQRKGQRDGQLEGQPAGVHRVLVSPDPGGRRVGSGTATLFALRALVERIRRERHDPDVAVDDALVGRRVFIIHSGGDSRRLPAYAAQGKIFTPLPINDGSPHTMTLFDLILRDLVSIEYPEAGGVIVAAGDVLLGVAKHQLRFEDDAITAVASPGPLDRAARHGVFVVDAKGFACEVLQKPDEAMMRTRGAIDAHNHALIDLGVAFIPAIDAARMVRDARDHGVFASNPPGIDFYADMLPALVANASVNHGDARAAAFLRTLDNRGLRVRSVPESLFFHIGSSRELVDRLTDNHAMQSIGVTGTPTPAHACEFASIIERQAQNAARCIIESCWITKATHCAGDNIVVGVPRECDAAISLPLNTGVVSLPIDENDWAAIAFGLDDDFKSTIDRGGTFGKRPLAALDPQCWRDDDERSLWFARLWRITSATAAVEHAIALLTNANHPYDERCLSAAEIMSRVNHRRLLDHRESIEREIAFRQVAARVRVHIETPEQPRLAVIAPGEIVRVTAPVRIDLAGGWSDTPPICHDVGGCVVNVAVRLDGAHPISAEARLIDEPLVRIRSIDLQQSIEIRDAAQLCAHRDPSDWAALPKAALVLSGIAPADPGASLAHWLDELTGGSSGGERGGIELTISSALPKGSGLGASSILGAATLACLARLTGETLSRERLIARTSALEQMMSTAGGWQDQAGGITPGCKLLITNPGSEQVPIETPLTIPADFWHERVLLYSTGLQRLARDILQNVVWRWLRGGDDIQSIVRQLREGALRMRDDLARGDLEAFTRGVLNYWELKQALDPGATTPVIESLIERVRPHLSAWCLPGAGGGGFLFMIARDARAANRGREILQSDPPNGAARFFEVHIDRQGLTHTMESA